MNPQWMGFSKVGYFAWKQTVLMIFCPFQNAIWLFCLTWSRVIPMLCTHPTLTQTKGKCNPSLKHFHSLSLLIFSLHLSSFNVSPFTSRLSFCCECRLMRQFFLAFLTLPLVSPRAGQRTLEKPSEVALLLSLNGVNCIVLNQWHSSLQQISEYVTNFLDSMF